MAAHAPDATFHWTDCLRPVRRWTAQRKAVLVDGINAGYLARARMLELHVLSDEELDSWIVKRFEAGERALRTTKLQFYPAVRC